MNESKGYKIIHQTAKSQYWKPLGYFHPYWDCVNSNGCGYA